MTPQASPKEAKTPPSQTCSGDAASRAAPVTPLELLCPRYPFPLLRARPSSASSRSMCAPAQRREREVHPESVQDGLSADSAAAAHTRMRRDRHADRPSAGEGKSDYGELRQRGSASCSGSRIHRLQTLLRLAVIARCMHAANAARAEAAGGKAKKGKSGATGKESATCLAGTLSSESATGEREELASPSSLSSPSGESAKPAGPHSASSPSRQKSGTHPLSSRPTRARTPLPPGRSVTSLATHQTLREEKESSPGDLSASRDACTLGEERRGDKSEPEAALDARKNPVRRDLERMPLHLLHPKHRPLALLFRASRTPWAALLRPVDFPQGFPGEGRAPRASKDPKEKNSQAKDQGDTARANGERDAEAETVSFPGVSRKAETCPLGDDEDEQIGGKSGHTAAVSLPGSQSGNVSNLDRALEDVLSEERIFPRVSEYLCRYFQSYADRRTLMLGLASSSPSTPASSPSLSVCPDPPSPSSPLKQPVGERPAFVSLTARRNLAEILGFQSLRFSAQRQDTRVRRAGSRGTTEFQIHSSPCPVSDACSCSSCPGSASRCPSRCAPPPSVSRSPASRRTGDSYQPEDERLHFSFDQAVQAAPFPRSPLSPSVSSLLQKLRGRVGRGPESRALTPQSLLAILERRARAEAWRRIAGEYVRGRRCEEEKQKRQRQRVEEPERTPVANAAVEAGPSAKKRNFGSIAVRARRESSTWGRPDLSGEESPCSLCPCAFDPSSAASCSGSVSSSPTPFSHSSASCSGPRRLCSSSGHSPPATERRAQATCLREPLAVACVVLERLREEYWAEVEKAAAGGHDPLPAFDSEPKEPRAERHAWEEREQARETRRRWQLLGLRRGTDPREEDVPSRSDSGEETNASRESAGEKVMRQDTKHADRIDRECAGKPQAAIDTRKTPAKEVPEAEGAALAKRNSDAAKTDVDSGFVVERSEESRARTQRDSARDKNVCLDAQVDFLLQMYLHTDQILRQNE
ncbi:K+ channel tetramerisation domain-containing protein [Neospora caninum Liverpool]|uniref:K channel tetramerisation domain-containing protein, putative n=1 Tax=Neospora caninum (strain Liverpool) TaxID=572307 RepID=F0VDX7_NEOCL|nr:K+ channel tetramerisation domain-containing protein [Neospora caninum Liverpool]CBZ51920.1 K+ channel tetramerisation domain-containing protein [Neospora caninum Liverpool]CEL65882.1 TPA: K channel tetramerisation domain-containing protein, putative [Neospora caninum Liverpool]|eukprot:XP_003881953.1 K+ channel tetramerisation domain-containing protein [Neospora caninum Liverpool]